MHRSLLRQGYGEPGAAYDRFILDADLAVLYGVSTKRLNEQFRRNRKRFPDDFAFQHDGSVSDS